MVGLCANIYGVDNSLIAGKFSLRMEYEGGSLTGIVREKGSENVFAVPGKVVELPEQKYPFMKRDKEGHYIMIKRSIQEEDITIISIYAPNMGAPQYVRQMLTSMKEIGRAHV